MPLTGHRKAQLAILKRMLAEDLTAADVSALVAKERFGGDALRPLSLALDGAGRARASTTAKGMLRVVLEGTDRAALDKLWRSLKKKIWGDVVVGSIDFR